MGKQNTKLELTWIGKENRPKLEPRILLEDPGKSYHAPHRVGENDILDNRLIFGDNLLALKSSGDMILISTAGGRSGRLRTWHDWREGVPGYPHHVTQPATKTGG